MRPVISLTNIMSDDFTFSCPVCLISGNGLFTRQTKCNHFFCISCIATLLGNSVDKCPTCRASFEIEGGTVNMSLIKKHKSYSNDTYIKNTLDHIITQSQIISSEMATVMKARQKARQKLDKI